MHMSSHVPRGILVELCKYVGNYRFSIRIRSWLAIYWCNGDALSQTWSVVSNWPRCWNWCGTPVSDSDAQFCRCDMGHGCDMMRHFRSLNVKPAGLTGWQLSFALTNCGQGMGPGLSSSFVEPAEEECWLVIVLTCRVLWHVPGAPKWQVTRTRCKTNKLKILKSWNILRFKRVFHTLRFGWFNILFNLLLAHHGGSALTSGYQTSAFQEQYEKALLLMELHASHIFAYFGSWHASPCTSQKLVSVPWIFAEPC